MIKNQSFFKDGRKYYEVNALGKASYISECTVIGGIEQTKYGPFLNIRVLCSNGKSFQGRSSLHDMNVIPNRYNHHKSFRTLMEARKYRNKCIRNSIGSYPVPRERDEYGDYFSDYPIGDDEPMNDHE